MIDIERVKGWGTLIFPAVMAVIGAAFFMGAQSNDLDGRVARNKKSIDMLAPRVGGNESEIHMIRVDMKTIGRVEMELKRQGKQLDLIDKRLYELVRQGAD